MNFQLRSIFLVIYIILFLSLSINPSLALSGQTVWQPGSQIVYNVDYKLDLHPFYINQGFSAYNLNSVNYKVSYVGLYESKMLFIKDTTSLPLANAIGLAFTSVAIDLIDPDTGKDINDNWGGYFYDTSNFEVGSNVSDIEFVLNYEDISGIHSIIKKYQVTEKTTSTFIVDTSNRAVDVWKLSVEDFDVAFQLFFDGEVRDFTYSFVDLEYIISSNGVIIELSQEFSLSVMYDVLIQLLNERIVYKAVESKNVKLDKSQPGIHGFEVLIFGVSLVFVVLFTKLMKSKLKQA